MKHSSGQSMTEFLIAAAFILVPLFIIVPMLGKYMDMSFKSQQAARYSAWERTAWYSAPPKYSTQSAIKSADAINNEVNHRIYSAHDIGIVKEQGETNESESKDPLHFSMNRKNREYEHMLETPSTTALSESGIDATSFELSDGITSLMSVEKDGLYRSEHTLDLKEPRWLSAQQRSLKPDELYAEGEPMFDLKISKHHALLVDGWTAGGNQHNRSMVHDLMALDFLRQLDEGVLGTARDLLAETPARELSSEYLDIGRVDTTAVPGQRLKQYNDE